MGEGGGEEVHRRAADEAGHIGVGRAGPDFHGCRDLRGVALVHHHQPVAERHRLHLVMGDEQGGDAEAALQAPDLGAHLHAQLGVEVGERLVEQEQLGLAHDGAAHGDALALPAGKLARLALQQGADAEQVGRFLHAALDLGLGQAADLRP
jgi:hypothetical protein